MPPFLLLLHFSTTKTTIRNSSLGLYGVSSSLCDDSGMNLEIYRVSPSYLMHCINCFCANFPCSSMVCCKKEKRGCCLRGSARQCILNRLNPPNINGPTRVVVYVGKLLSMNTQAMILFSQPVSPWSSVCGRLFWLKRTSSLLFSPSFLHTTFGIKQLLVSQL